VVAGVLLLAVPLDRGRVLLPVLPPVIRIAGPPLSQTVQADLAVFRVGGDLLAVIVGAALALAIGLAADRLLWTEAGGFER
jgi:hypothetical protein